MIEEISELLIIMIKRDLYVIHSPPELIKEYNSTDFDKLLE